MEMHVGKEMEMGLSLCAARPTNSFSLLAMGCDLVASPCAGTCGPRAALAGEAKVGSGQPKRARPSDFDVGRAPVKPMDQRKGPSNTKKGLAMSNRSKGKALAYQEGLVTCQPSQEALGSSPSQLGPQRKGKQWHLDRKSVV